VAQTARIIRVSPPVHRQTGQRASEGFRSGATPLPMREGDGAAQVTQSAER
jgi:hypothetical protein